MIPMRKCSVCGEEFPRTKEYFNQQTSSKDGLRNYCKKCHVTSVAKWNKEHPERVRENSRKKTATYRAKNRDKVLAGTRDWRARNPNKIKEYRDNHRPAFVIYTQTRRARKRSLPDTFTLKDWEFALNYFNHCCAVCGNQLNGLFHTAAADHWIPLSSPDCPGTVPTNIIPLCHGVNGCNNSKAYHHPEDWLVKRYGKRKAKPILKRIHDYFASIKPS